MKYRMLALAMTAPGALEFPVPPLPRMYRRSRRPRPLRRAPALIRISAVCGRAAQPRRRHFAPPRPAPVRYSALSPPGHDQQDNDEDHHTV
jgi:hypothetical protein